MAGRPRSRSPGVDSGPGEGGSEGLRGAPEPFSKIYFYCRPDVRQVLLLDSVDIFPWCREHWRRVRVRISWGLDVKDARCGLRAVSGLFGRLLGRNLVTNGSFNGFPDKAQAKQHTNWYDAMRSATPLPCQCSRPLQLELDLYVAGAECDFHTGGHLAAQAQGYVRQ